VCQLHISVARKEVEVASTAIQSWRHVEFAWILHFKIWDVLASQIQNVKGFIG